MKKRVIALFVVLATGIMCAQAQRISVRLNFPGNAHARYYDRPSFSGAIWIGPEWQWRGGRYVSVPGYWSRPSRYGAVWVNGYWRHSRHGYYWVPGHWR